MSQRYIGGLIYNPPGGFSGYFDGTDDFIYVADSSAFTLGSGDFTVEAWVWTGVTATQKVISGQIDGSGTTASLSYQLELSSSDFPRLIIASGGTLYIATSSVTLPKNQWVHVAGVRDGSTLRIYVNGVQYGTQSVTGVTVNDSSANVSVGRHGQYAGLDWNGYISNFRLVKGTCVYPSGTTFTPPVGPLQAIPNTSLLTCAYPTFRDGSSNNFTITVNGNTAVSTQNPFPLTALPNPNLGNQGNGVYSMSQYQALRSQNLWPAIDPYFDYVTLMLHGNGTNGAQNNTFLDSSTNNFTITRNGNTTQGTFTPYGANWSNYFDGTGDYLSLPSSTNLALGTGAFTIEAWVFNASTEALFPSIGACSSPSGITQFGFSNSANSVTRVVLGNLDYPSSGNSILLKGSASVGVGQWAHVAYVRDSGVITIYLNGVSVGTVSDARDSVQQLRSVGASYSTYFAGLFFEWLGNISNLRFVKGSAVYASNFTPSTAPITAITNTQLLTCQSNRFIDNSSNAFAITVNGNTSVQRFSPFNPTTPYAAGTIGGSGYFDGVGDYLNCGSNAALRPGTSDYTIEMWVYLPTFSTDMYLITQDFNNAGGSFGNFLFYADNTTGTCKFFSSTTGSSWNVINALNMGTLRTNEWTHFAVARQSGTVRTFRNGDLIASTSDGSADLSNTGNLLIATYGANIDTNAYMSGIRLQKGTAQYTASFTCPTAPPTAITNTSLLLNFTNGGIIDNAMMNDLETVGNAQISTSVSKFGGGSLAFDGSGDYLIFPANSTFQFGTGDFTIEFWTYLNSVSGFQMFIDNRNSTASTGAYITIYADGSTLFFYTTGNDRITATSALSTGTWLHIAVARSGTSTKMFLNGTQVGSTYTDSNSYLAASTNQYIGARVSSNDFNLNGYIDDLRITKGYARYTANFTPQRSQWQDQ